ncbi:MAG: helix-turn-helix domain-containing protein [Eubacterium sp.]|nr:helix-turn-helix domain-containing protein [Eubacterium sp.]
MTAAKKQEFIKAFGELLEAVIIADTTTSPIPKPVDNSVELLTVKECTQMVKGLSEHAVRRLIAQNKIPHIRIGGSKRGKILIEKNDLLSYLKTTA